MYTSCLDKWYDKGISFSLTCSCGELMSGIIRRGDIQDKLHCRCGLVWTIPKPQEEK